MRNRLPVARPQVQCAGPWSQAETGGVIRTQLSSLRGIMSLSIEPMFLQMRALQS